MERSRPATSLTDDDARGFRSVVLDVDSTLCGVEGIDWLAERRGESVAERVAIETARAMRGEIPLEAVYAKRLELVRPTETEILDLSEVYRSLIASGARDVISAWLKRGVVVSLVTSGIRQAVLPVASDVGISPERVFAVGISFDKSGAYSGFDRSSPLTTAMGKREILASLGVPRPVLMVGDGSTDLAARPAADAFAAFTGFVTREGVTARADFVASSFSELDTIVTNGNAA